MIKGTKLASRHRFLQVRKLSRARVCLATVQRSTNRYNIPPALQKMNAFARLFGSKGPEGASTLSSSSSPSALAPPCSPSHHRIFLIPEVISLILSFLSTHALLHRARLVSRQWYLVASILAEPRLSTISINTAATWNPALLRGESHQLINTLMNGRSVRDPKVRAARALTEGSKDAVDIGNRRWACRTLVLQANPFRKWYDYGGHGVMSTAEEREQAWSCFSTQLLDITHGIHPGSESTFSRAKISSLVVHGDISVQTRVVPLLKKSFELSSGSKLGDNHLPPYWHIPTSPDIGRRGGLALFLTEIQILEAMSEPNMSIDSILAFCPHLLRLNLESAAKRHASDFLPVQVCLPKNDFLATARSKWSHPLKLKYLTIKRMRMSRVTVDALTQCCSALESLEFINIHPARLTPISTEQCSMDGEVHHEPISIPSLPLDRMTLYQIVTEKCPLLRHVHISLESSSPATLEEVHAFTDAFVDLESWSFETKELGINFEALVALRTTEDQQLDQDRLQGSLRVERGHSFGVGSLFLLTSLEIISSIPDFLPSEDLVRSVHAFLVSPSARSLKQLKLTTPPASFIHRLGHHIGRGLLQSKDSCGIPYSNTFFNPYLFNQHKIWTCRSLETLYLKVQFNGGESSFYITTPFSSVNAFANRKLHSLMSWNSRCVISYLVRAIPNCKELCLMLPSLASDLKLEGGLCILRRMSKMERVCISYEAAAPTALEERDLAWLMSSSSRVSTSVTGGWLGSRSVSKEAARSKRLAWITQLKRKVQTPDQGQSPSIRYRVDPQYIPPAARYTATMAVTEDESSVDQMARSVGNLQDIVDCLEGLSLDMGSPVPLSARDISKAVRLARAENLGLLEYLIIERRGARDWKGSEEETTVALVKDLRPDLIFRIEGQ